ncbi:MAG: OmpA family protein [Acidobacteria bacterium]|nr:OmpA family protein [Acidobacteriota bacterium]
MRKTLLAGFIITLSVAVAPACATKGFVREEVGAVNTKVDTLGGSVEQTQQRVGQTEQRIGQNEQRIGAVDQKAEAAGKSAADARAAAGTAQGAADKAQAAATSVGGRVDAVQAEVRKLIYEVTLSEDQGNFRLGSADLPDEARARLDAVVNDLKSKQQNIFIEIEGHTDNTGSAEYNEQLGLERAEAVKRYLYEQHQIPLHRMNVISFGEEKPVAPNNTRQGRAQNRRVVVKVLS